MQPKIRFYPQKPDMCQIFLSFFWLSCETLTTPEGYTLTQEGEHVLRCLTGVLGSICTCYSPFIFTYLNNAAVLMILMLSLLVFITISYNGNSIPNATASLNETTSADISNNNNKTTTIPINLEENVLLYEAKIGNLASTRVLNVIGEPQLEHSIVENGIITGVGNVTNIQTWIDTLRTPKVTYGEPQSNLWRR